MKLEVLNIEGNKTGRKVELPESVFGIKEPKDHLIHEDVRLIQANKRQGTAKTKERSEVHGTGKKPYRQKGTGNARAGDSKSPLWRHGGTAFGPRPRDYGFKMNKKAKSLARASAYTYKAQDKKISLLENFSFEGPKTKDFINMLNKLEMQENKVLLVLPEYNQNVYLSGRNLLKAQVRKASDVSTLDILHADNLLIVEEAIAIIENNIQKN